MQKNIFLKVLLINPPPQNFQEIPQRCWPPLSLSLIAEPLVRQNIDVEILDANALSMPTEQICDYVSKSKANLIGLPLYSEQLKLNFNLTESIKKRCPFCCIVLGGPHASILPDQTLQQFKSVDYVLRGEAEKSLSDLCLALIKDKDLSVVLGLSFRSKNGDIVHNDSAKIVENLDTIHHLERGLLEQYYKDARYNTIMLSKKNIDTLLTSRGCPFQCNFCHNINSSYRFHSVDYLMEEIFRMHKRGIEVIEIIDDNFTVNRERAINLFKKIIKENLKILFRIKSRVDMVDEELISYARKAGVYLIAYGAESGCQQILDRMNKSIKIEDIVRACNLAKKFGIYCHTSWILGYQGETLETMEETFRLIQKIKPTTVQIEILKPYPLTRVYEEAVVSGALRGDWDISLKSLPWVQLPWIKEYSDLLQLRNKMLRRIYLRPYYIANFLLMSAKNFNFRLTQYMLQELIKIFSRSTQNKMQEDKK